MPGPNAEGKYSVSHSTTDLFSGATQVTPQYANINVGTGTTTVVAGIPGKIIRVISMDIVVTTASTVSWNTSSGAQVSGPQAYVQGGGIVRPFNPVGWFATAPGDGLQVTLTAGAGGGDLTFTTE